MIYCLILYIQPFFRFKQKKMSIAPPGFEPGSSDVFDFKKPPKSGMIDHYTTGLMDDYWRMIVSG